MTPARSPGMTLARYLPRDELCEILCAAPINGFLCKETDRELPGVFFADRSELDFNVPRLRVVAA